MIETSAGKQTVITMDKLPGKVMNNHVLLKMDFVPDDNTEFVTESGFKLILAGGEWNEATRMPRYGTVVRVPNRLYVRTEENKFGYGMDWKTVCEVKEGDLVFIGKIASANAIVVMVGSDVYFLVSYGDLIVRVRDGEIYPLNGYVALGKVFKRTRSTSLELGFADKQDKKRGVIRYVGRPNDYYYGTNAKDAHVEVGDEVVLHAELWTELEADTFRHLDEELGFCQMCWLVAKEN